MNDLVPKQRSRTRLFVVWTTGVLASIATLVALVDAFRYSGNEVAVLVAAGFIAWMIAPFSFRIPGSDSEFSPAILVSFCGTAMMGVAGGVLLPLVSAVAAAKDFRKEPERWAADVSGQVIAGFCGALGYFTVSILLNTPELTVAAVRLSIPNSLMVAFCVMAAVHYITAAAINFIEIRSSGRKLDLNAFEQIFRKPIISYVLCLGLAISLFIVFRHFGIEFGLVLIPLAIGANAAYKIHLRSLAGKTRELMEASRLHLATVEAIATAIDARDQIGTGHVRRTQIYAVGMGRLLNLPPEEIDALRMGALLHDIGKLAVPDHILNKPGRLTSAEMEKVKIHSSVGASILEKVGFQSPVVPTVKYHHEYWDGSGYPEGLRGSHIPLTARILSIADSYDSLRGDRPYRSAISREDACGVLRACSGTRFDPRLVDLFLRNLPYFEAEIESEGLAYESLGVTDSANISNPNFVEQIKRANREVFTLYSLAREFSAALNLEETLSLFASKISDFVPYDICAIYLLEDSGEFAKAVYVAGRDADSLMGRRIRIGEGATGYVLKKQKPVENVDPTLDFGFMRPDGYENLRTLASRPLIADNKLIGAVTLYTSKITNYQDEHIRLLDTVCRIAADAIAKSQIHAVAASHALTDPITGLPNARSLHIQFEKEVQRAIRNGTEFQLLMLDLDGFKEVNDNFGHKVGDNLLTAIGQVIRGELREYDFLARYAGDEFVAIIPGADSESITDLCRRIEAAVNSFGIEVDTGVVAGVGVSIGAASYPIHGETFDQLVISADKAMYVTKALHRRNRSRSGSPPDSGTSGGADYGLSETADVADEPIEASAVNERQIMAFGSLT
ncbi:MAG: diguanylate cyclase [Acidobacteriota bacterium]|jgi:diguanylate cyclase (GGDEF)-like protein/putative nucleotidyltransferase with HDIG domain